MDVFDTIKNQINKKSSKIKTKNTKRKLGQLLKSLLSKLSKYFKNSELIKISSYSSKRRRAVGQPINSPVLKS